VGRSHRRLVRQRIGRVSIFVHHQAWWIYFRESGRPVRRRIGTSRGEAEQVAAQVNSQLAARAPTILAFEPIDVPTLRQRFLDYHEHVLNSSLATVRRYRAATYHLEIFSQTFARPLLAHALRADAFASFLRSLAVAPNGHPNTPKRRLRDKGVQFVLETCRSMFTFAGKRRHLPPYTGNPFGDIPIDKLRIVDAKPIFVFDAQSERAFLQAANPWEFPIHFTLAKTGLRVGELTHLLIEDLDLNDGWLHVRNKTALGWRIKTGHERAVPLLPELITVLQRDIGRRPGGPVFWRRRFCTGVRPPLSCNREELETALNDRALTALGDGSRQALAKVAQTIWRDAGAIKPDHVRTSFIRLAQSIGHPTATCPKSWRHSFATLLQDANVDPLVRQITLGHQPAGVGLGMTGQYTHTRPETQRRQIEAALRRWQVSLEIAQHFSKGGGSCS